jgi:hypothetical protein
MPEHLLVTIGKERFRDKKRGLINSSRRDSGQVPHISKIPARVCARMPDGQACKSEWACVVPIQIKEITAALK